MIELLRWCRRTVRRALRKRWQRARPHDKSHIRSVREDIDTRRWNALRDEWTARDSRDFNHFYIKYFDIDRWLPGAMAVAHNAGLDRGPRKRVLDLGCGGGLLGRVVGHFGHDYCGLDVGNPMFMAMCEALGVKALVAPVLRRQPLPEGLTGYDVITSINPMFYRREVVEGRFDHYGWDDGDWIFFLADLRSRLRPDGIYYSKFNAEDELPPGLWKLLDGCRRLDQKTFLIRRDQLPESAALPLTVPAVQS